jgi:hypothetical protein
MDKKFQEENFIRDFLTKKKRLRLGFLDPLPYRFAVPTRRSNSYYYKLHNTPEERRPQEKCS